jgi:hypothetical protein
MRHDTEKLFWSDPDAWYCVDAKLLFSGGFPGDTYDDLDCMAHVEQIELDMTYFKESSEWVAPEDQEAYEDLTTNELDAPPALIQHKEDQMRVFWANLQRLFPRATCVDAQIGDCWTEVVPETFHKFVQMCPAGISVSVTLLFGKDSADPSLVRNRWRLAADGNSMAGKWEKIDPDFTRLSILLPPKEFRGLVGAWQRSNYVLERFHLKQDGKRLNLLTAIEKHHHARHEPFSCPYADDCDARFETPGEFFRHALHTEHVYDSTAEPPEEFMLLFEQSEKRSKQLIVETRYRPFPRITTILREMVNEKEHHNGDQVTIPIMEREEQYRQEYATLFQEHAQRAEKAFLYQLKNDPLYKVSTPEKETYMLGVHQRCVRDLWELEVEAMPSSLGR